MESQNQKITKKRRLKKYKIKVRILVHSSGSIEVDGVYFNHDNLKSVLALYPKKDFIIESIEPWCWKVGISKVEHVKQVLDFKKET